MCLGLWIVPILLHTFYFPSIWYRCSSECFSKIVPASLNAFFARFDLAFLFWGWLLGSFGVPKLPTAPSEYTKLFMWKHDIFANCLIDFLLIFQPQDGLCHFYWGLPLPNVVGSQQQLQDLLLNKESAHATSWVNCLITFGLLKNRKLHIKHLISQPFLKSWCEYWLNYSRVCTLSRIVSWNS